MGLIRRKNWLRFALLAGLCWSLVLQTFMVQAAGIEAVTADAQPVLCHNVSDESPADDNGFTRCHLCWLPGSSTVLLSDAAPALLVSAVVTAPVYSFHVASFAVIKPPPRGSSRAPPSFA